MILFLEDWNKYPEAVVHTQTSNKSFIHLANLLKSMGVKNYFFHLALHDKRLIGVDPFSENLTDEEITWMSAECAVNPWYYFREIASAPSTSKRVQFRANRANISMFWSYFNHCQYLLIQPRQTGKSFSTDTLMIYLLNFTQEAHIMLYTKDDSIRTGNVDRIRNMFENLPDVLNFMDKNDSANMQNITVNANNSWYKTEVAQSSEGAADKKGRGATVKTRHGDEIAYCNYASVTLPTMGSAMNAAIETAKENNQPWGTIFTTTAGKKDSRDGGYAYSIYKESAEWNDKLFYDSQNAYDFEQNVRRNSNPEDEMAKAEGVFAIQGTFSHRQLGYTDSWLKDAMIRNKVYGEVAMRDYFNVWTSGTEISPFTVKQAEEIQFSMREPEWRDFGVEGLVMNWYYPIEEIEYRMKHRPIIAGLDTSNMTGRDSTCLTLVDATTLEVIGAGSFNNINSFIFVKWLCDFMVRYPKILLVAENKLNAQGMIDYLLESFPAYGINPLQRMFNIIIQEKDTNPKQYLHVQQSGGHASSTMRKSFGYTTAGSGSYSRNNLYNETLYRAISMGSMKIHDERLVKELLGLIIVKDRIDHQLGGHDDQVISYLLACWFILNGKHLNHYDINQTKFLTDVNGRKELDPEKAREKRIQEDLRDKLMYEYNRLNECYDPFQFKLIERNIKHYESKLTRDTQIELSVDEMIKSVKDKQIERNVNSHAAVFKSVLNIFN